MNDPKPSLVNTRRRFIRDLGALTAAALAVPVSSASDEAPSMPANLPANSVLLFQGDSITDCSRDRTRTWPNDPAALGSGYVGRIAGDLAAEHPGAGWQFLNRGISGDRSIDLLARWRKDALRLQPHLVSILVGVNDTWHERLNGNGVPIERFGEIFRMLLVDLRREQPRVRLVLGEPFSLQGGDFKDEWRDELRKRSEVVRDLAREFSGSFVPYQDVFDRALDRFSPSELASDGIHPSPLGHRLMAEAWRRAVGI
jgi:acyl-CoA thioesterase I